jgi:hypothetical protein
MAKKKYLIKEQEGLYTVHNDFFDDIESRDEALMLAIMALDELHLTLKEEVDDDDSVLIGNLKVTTGLQRSLDELNKRWPSLLNELYSTPRVVNGRVIALC